MERTAGGAKRADGGIPGGDGNGGGKARLAPTRRVKLVSLMAIALALALLLGALAASCGKGGGALRVGHGGGYLSAALYVAAEGLGDRVDVQSFHSMSDAAYSLLSGKIDVGFVEAEKLAALSELEGFDKLTVAGKVTYPYGATLVVRKGLDARLQELGGLTVAAATPSCVLLKEFSVDASRLKADISGVKYKYMAFDAMIPALEAKAADAALIKGTYSVIALQEGHSILYQNWEVEPGDECCPAVIDQAALVLLVRRDKLDAAKPFIDAMLAAQKLPLDTLRQAVADHTAIPFEILKEQPVPEFSIATDELVGIFVKAANEDHEEGEDDGDEQ